MNLIFIYGPPAAGKLTVAKALSEINGYKLFRSDDIHKLKFIMQAKELGFTLSHIKDLLRRVKGGESICALVREQMEVNIKDCEEEIAQLNELRMRMELALQRWEMLPNEEPNTNIWCHLIENPK